MQLPDVYTHKNYQGSLLFFSPASNEEVGSGEEFSLHKDTHSGGGTTRAGPLILCSVQFSLLGWASMTMASTSPSSRLGGGQILYRVQILGFHPGLAIQNCCDGFS